MIPIKIAKIFVNFQPKHINTRVYPVVFERNSIFALSFKSATRKTFHKFNRVFYYQILFESVQMAMPNTGLYEKYHKPQLENFKQFCKQIGLESNTGNDDYRMVSGNGKTVTFYFVNEYDFENFQTLYKLQT